MVRLPLRVAALIVVSCLNAPVAAQPAGVLDDRVHATERMKTMRRPQSI